MKLRSKLILNRRPADMTEFDFLSNTGLRCVGEDDYTSGVRRSCASKSAYDDKHRETRPRSLTAAMDIMPG